MKWSARLDIDTEEIVMKATIPNRSYLSIGFGENMRGTDMIIWRWKDNETEVDNLYSSGYEVPPSDGTDFLKTTVEMSSDGQFKTFTTRRAMDTGNSKDFVIQPDQDIVMCYAYRTGNGNFIQHKERDIFSIKFSASGAASEGDLDLTSLRRNDFYEAHGLWMWVAWMPVGFLLLVTKRYVKKQWNCMHVLHAILGYFVLIVTMIWGFKILDYFDWTVNRDIHSIAGIASMILCLIVALSGTFTAGLQQFYHSEKAWTPKEKVTKVGKFHRYAGYLMLFLANATAF